jgi:hypothetical protein
MQKSYTRALSIEELIALPDEQIDTSDIPELDEAFWKDARIVEPKIKPTISLRLSNRLFYLVKNH